MFGLDDSLEAIANIPAPAADFAADLGMSVGSPAFFSAGGTGATGPWSDFFSAGGTGGGTTSPDAASFASTLFGNLGKQVSGNPLGALTAALGLGTTGLGVANAVNALGQGRQQQQFLQQGQRQAQAAAQPAIAYGTEQISAARAGQLPPAVEADIAVQVQKAKADIRAKLASMGISDSTTIRQYEDEIDRRALALKAQFLQSQGAGGVSALLGGANAGLAAGQVGANQEQLIAAILASTNQQLGQLGARL